ncbi:PREDICTED: uncharacterized protein LOC107190259 [Dufourea novaeangliae]|uniref:Uncharacterized protein n=1 Tax=Dufourea novaeangliae TaxID=178035 RepID=A0A154PJX3_DUFNO|nr:PREDICTED: uncharacterized protein LOC107190259 [Dufourea novaeangliae]KZC12142.1 hypothetical protein WN55_03223 [Dufourea novaeangliae]
MSKELHKCLINYFSQLEKVDCKWRELSEEAKRPLHALRNQSEQLRLVTSKEVNNAELCKIDGVYERLIYKILMGIDNELTLLLDVLKRFNNANQDLRNRLKKLEYVRSKVSLSDETMQELINGTPYRPKLNSLLEWAINGLDYYHDLYRNINENIKQYDYKRVETIENLTKSFIEDRFKRLRIDHILGFTQFLIKETVR